MRDIRQISGICDGAIGRLHYPEVTVQWRIRLSSDRTGDVDLMATRGTSAGRTEAFRLVRPWRTWLIEEPYSHARRLALYACPDRLIFGSARDLGLVPGSSAYAWSRGDHGRRAYSIKLARQRL